MTATHVLLVITVQMKDSVLQRHCVSRAFTALAQLIYLYLIQLYTSVLEVSIVADIATLVYCDHQDY